MRRAKPLTSPVRVPEPPPDEDRAAAPRPDGLASVHGPGPLHRL